MNNPLQPITVTRAELLLAISAGHITFPTYFLVSDAVSNTNEIVVVCNSSGIADEAYNKTLTEEGVYDINADIWTASGGGGVTDHGALTGLGDDDHPQYHNDARALTWLGTRTTNDLPETTNKRYVSDAQEAKIDFLTVTQPVDLDDIETRVNNLDAAVVLKGSWDASAGTFPGGGTAQAGYSYIVSVAGAVDGVSFNINDRIIAILDNASTTTFAANWFKADYTDQFLSLDGNVGTVTLGALIAALTGKTTPVDGDTLVLSDSAASNASKKLTWANVKATLKTYFDTLYQAALGYTAENTANKDATGGYAGLTLFKINFKNVANTFTSFFTNTNTAARTYTFPDKDMTVAGIDDVAMVLLETATASNSPVIDFTILNNTYSNYIVFFNDVVPVSNASEFWIRVGTGATPTWASGGSDYSHVRVTNNTLTSVATDAKIILATSVSNNANNAISGQTQINNPSQTGSYHSLRSDSGGITSGSVIYTSRSTGEYLFTTAVTSIRFMINTGNIASGIFKLYGIK